MTVKDFHDLTLYFAVNGQSYKIKGLRAQSFELNNKFLNTNNILDLNWEAKLPNSAKQSLNITLSGEYHTSKAQDILKNCAFNNQELEFRIYLDNQLIEGKFLIAKYDITSPFDQFIEFEITLVSSSKITYSLI